MLDAPLGEGWLIDRVGPDFTLLVFGARVSVPAGVTVVTVQAAGLARERYDARPGTAYLIRPDRYVAARWRQVDAASVAKAVERAMGKEATCSSGR